MVSVTQAELSVLHDSAGAITAQADKLSGHLQKIEDQVETLCGSWRGQARNSFEQPWNNWDEPARDLLERLYRMAADIVAFAIGLEEQDNTDSTAIASSAEIFDDFSEVQW